MRKITRLGFEGRDIARHGSMWMWIGMYWDGYAASRTAVKSSPLLLKNRRSDGAVRASKKNEPFSHRTPLLRPSFPVLTEETSFHCKISPLSAGRSVACSFGPVKDWANWMKLPCSYAIETATRSI